MELTIFENGVVQLDTGRIAAVFGLTDDGIFNLLVLLRRYAVLTNASI